MYGPTLSSGCFIVGAGSHSIEMVTIKGYNYGMGYIKVESGAGSGCTEIPEFPTMALPVAAILGLAFIFQRRRD
ncbi:PEF-CTERM sorting domain-containing protein [Methanolobus sp. ZRKC3]|uniref:PEF-CTERM sorting domain-containing protein n=1 Tax=Methanolobus sp. ZRKC3 TaxID=3125786 RepID=UPI0032468D5E